MLPICSGCFLCYVSEYVSRTTGLKLYLDELHFVYLAKYSYYGIIWLSALWTSIQYMLRGVTMQDHHCFHAHLHIVSVNMIVNLLSTTLTLQNIRYP